MMRFSYILHHPHFNNLAAILRWPFRSAEWKKRHGKVRFGSLFEALDDALAQPFNAQHWLWTLRTLLVEIGQADPWLAYREEDLVWLAAQMNEPHAASSAGMFMATFRAPDEMLTPAEIAAATGTAESGWRNKAAAGQIPGALKKGKQWLLPRSVVCSQLSPPQAELLKLIEQQSEVKESQQPPSRTRGLAPASPVD
ncbi:MAG: helix-turn-helix domain-containing protein [Ardenticatenales bacterium]|nr:helix-turn-helix domain-containing protein [Ardenticatenales bacterium]